MNWTMRLPLSGTFSDIGEYTASMLSNPYLASDFTGSEFQPYITSVALYNNGEYDEPVIIGDLPKPLRVSDKVTMILKLRLDM